MIKNSFCISFNICINNIVSSQRFADSNGKITNRVAFRFKIHLDTYLIFKLERRLYKHTKDDRQMGNSLFFSLTFFSIQ